MKARIRMVRTFMWYRKERCEEAEIDIDLSTIPEIAAKMNEGFEVRDVRRAP